MSNLSLNQIYHLSKLSVNRTEIISYFHKKRLTYKCVTSLLSENFLVLWFWYCGPKFSLTTDDHTSTVCRRLRLAWEPTNWWRH